jgi:hypothetical protein
MVNNVNQTSDEDEDRPFAPAYGFQEDEMRN